MIHSSDDEKDKDQAQQGIHAGEAGEGAHSLQSGVSTNVGRKEEEITEDMIEAGFSALCISDLDNESFSTIAKRVFMAMKKAQR